MATTNYYPVQTGGFGSDTTISLPNAIAVNVTALEMVTALTNSTSGSEASQFVIKLLTAGAQTTAMDIRAGQTLYPTGTSSVPSVSFQASTSSGMYWDNGATQLSFAVGGTRRFGVSGGALFLYSDTGQLSIQSSGGSTPFVAIQRTASANVKVAITNPTGDVVLGETGARATNATIGFVQLPSTTGTPTGVPGQLEAADMRPMILDTGASKMWVNFAGTWKAVTFV